MDTAEIHALRWSESAHCLLTWSKRRGPTLAALTWPARETLWERRLESRQTVLCWDVEGSVLVLDEPKQSMQRFDHATGHESASAPVPAGHRIGEFDRMTSFGAHGVGVLTGSAYLELDTSLSLCSVVNLECLPPSIAFMDRGIARITSDPSDPWRAIVYQAGFVLVRIDEPTRATMVITETRRQFGQKPFDPVPNPIDPLSKFFLVDVDSPESLGTVEHPTFVVGAAVWHEPTLFLFGGPFSSFILGFNLAAGTAVPYYAEGFRAHNHRPTIESIGADAFVVEGSYGTGAEFRTAAIPDAPGFSRLFRRPLKFPSPARFTYAQEHGGYIHTRGVLGEQTLELTVCDADESEVPTVDPASPGVPQYTMQSIDLTESRDE